MELRINITSSIKRAKILPKSPQMVLTITGIIIIFTSQLQVNPSMSQQQYVNNDQLNCYTNNSDVKGFVCNSTQSSCTAYVTFRSDPPSYATPSSIAFLLNSSASAISKLNNISDVDPIPAHRLVVVPVTCVCTGTGPNSESRRRGRKHYMHEATYKLKTLGENYFTMANNTYQGLTTCHAMRAQNPYDFTGLSVGDDLVVPVMCACPTERQVRKYGAKYLVSYLVTWGDDTSIIADMFGVDEQSVLDANDLKTDDIIFPFTPILVPLKSAPTKVNHPSRPPLGLPPQFNPNITTPGGGEGSLKKRVFVGIGIGAGGLLLLISSFLAWFFLVRPSRNQVSTTQATVNKDDPEGTEYTTLPGSYSSTLRTPDGFKVAIGSLTAYKFEALQKATRNFSVTNRIKGSVFRGDFNGDAAAIKVLKGNVSADEINLLKHINHSNITRLSGYCFREGNTYLVYKYAQKGSLDTWLLREQNRQAENDSQRQPGLAWKQRIQIVCDVADALNYLHSYINPPYIHKNLKSSNVLLDASYRAWITNFGLARAVKDVDEDGEVHLTENIVGTHGYLAPEYVENGAVTPTMDVFAFGVVLLELLSGKPAVKPSGMSHGNENNLLLFVVIRNVLEGDNIMEKVMGFMDPNLAGEYPRELAYSMAQLANKCVDPNMNSRPSMSEVSVILSKIYSLSMDWDPMDTTTTTTTTSTPTPTPTSTSTSASTSTATATFTFQ